MPTIFSEKLFARFEAQFRPFLAKLEIPDAVFKRRDIEVADVKYVELLETVARETNPNIGLDMADAVSPSDLGVLGHAMAATESIGQALLIFSRYLYVLSQSNTIRLDVGEKEAVCSYSVTILQPDMVRQDAEFVLGFVTRLISKLSARKFTPHRVEFSHTRLGTSQGHERFFGCDILFERPVNRIHFSKKVLDYPVLSSDEGLLEALLFYLDDRLIIRSEDEDVVAKTRHLISISLSEGLATLEQVSSRLGMSKRSLQRKLGEKNIVFSEMVDSICKSIADDYVRHTEYSLTDVALMLGYGDLSSFSRAFKRWSGVSPQQVRDAREPETTPNHG